MTFSSLACKLLYASWLSNDCDEEIFLKTPVSYRFYIPVTLGGLLTESLFIMSSICVPRSLPVILCKAEPFFCSFPAVVHSSLEHLITDAEVTLSLNSPTCVYISNAEVIIIFSWTSIRMVASVCYWNNSNVIVQSLPEVISSFIRISSNLSHRQCSYEWEASTISYFFNKSTFWNASWFSQTHIQAEQEAASAECLMWHTENN